MLDEGYIKFNLNWTKEPPLASHHWQSLNHWRKVMYDLNLIGAYENGIGFGNISQRFNEAGQFIISGTQTGNLPILNGNHYSLVTEVFPAENKLFCEGPIKASSESMSHAVIYQQCAKVNAVIHIHNSEMWITLLHKIPTTDKSATYGTPEMANSIIKLLKTTNLPQKKIFVMEGHEEGIFAFGETLEAAATLILNYFKQIHHA